MALLQGFDGSVTITTTGSPTVVGKVKKWSGDVSFKETEEGPFIGGDGTTEVVSTSKMIKGKLECVVPLGRDAGQSALMAAALAFGTFNLSLVETNGYTVTVATAKVSGFAFDNDGAGSVKLTFDFRNSGTFSILSS
ncbi:MAG: hypothetical protein IPP13_21650 [Kouleothrix sp.]|jgi:hypothetical protein|nr:hypothetical protein [Kouleothrix sp.]